MAANDFFNTEETNAVPETPVVEKVKVGEREFTQEELDRRIGLSDIALEAEEKFNTKIDRIWPEFTKKTQAEKEYQAKIQELEEKSKTQDQVSGNLTQDQVEEAKRQLESILGGKPMTQSQFDSMYLQRRNAEKLIDDAQSVVEEAKEAGTPQTDIDQLLKHMEDTGIRNPKKAYRDMFETELDRIKEQKLLSIKPQGIQTATGSTAGSKQPAPVKVTDENIKDLLQSHFNK